VILQHPDAKLRLVAEPVARVSMGVRRLYADMAIAMSRAQGAGLSANQIGARERMFIVSSRVAGGYVPRAFINPELTYRGPDMVLSKESCLSLPDVTVVIERHQKVRVRALDLQGESFEVAADGFLARCLQHELDHLDGVLMIDHPELDAPPSTAVRRRSHP
jgi:peptide deformylase